MRWFLLNKRKWMRGRWERREKRGKKHKQMVYISKMEVNTIRHGIDTNESKEWVKEFIFFSSSRIEAFLLVK